MAKYVYEHLYIFSPIDSSFFHFPASKRVLAIILSPQSSRLWPCYSIIVVAEIRVHAFLILYGRETRHTYYICFHQYRYRLYATFLSLTFTGYEPQNKHRVLHTFRVWFAHAVFLCIFICASYVSCQFVKTDPRASSSFSTSGATEIDCASG